MNINDYINNLYDNDLTLEEIIDAARKVKTQRDAEMAASKQKETVKKARLTVVEAIKAYLRLIFTDETFTDADFEELSDTLVDKLEEMEEELVRINKVAQHFRMFSDKSATPKTATTNKQAVKSDDEALANFLKQLKAQTSAAKRNYNPFDF